jgi:SAM-dependent methyltransferase/ribosomal protein S18 acetylase RimI-like enzyme
MLDQSNVHGGPGTAGLEAEEARIRAAYAKRPIVDRRYSWFNRAHLLIEQEFEWRSLELLKRQQAKMPLEERRILEVGCGTGFRLRQFVKWGARPENLFGVELLADALDEARHLCPSRITFRCGDAARLDWPDATFDVVIQSMAFTSILDPQMKRQVAEEMLRVLKPEGFIFWYDFLVDNPRNPDVRGVAKPEIRELFPGCEIELKRITLAPPVARAVAPFVPSLYHVLATIPLLRTHYLGMIHKSAQDISQPLAPATDDRTVKGAAKASGWTIRRATLQDLQGIIEVHMLSFPHFFLTNLGPGFLRTYYALVLEYQRGVLLVAEERGRVLGFAAGFIDPSSFYQIMTATRSRFLFPALVRLVEHPTLLFRLLKNVRRVIKLKQSPDFNSSDSCELASIAVHPDAMRRGLGKALVRSFVGAVEAERAARVCLTTDADNNDPTNAFYRDLGFRCTRTFEAPGKRRMNEYVLSTAGTTIKDGEGATS